MKISKLFHTLYAFLMFLPVMVLPLFAININQKEVEPLTAQIEETKIVDFNQMVPNQYIDYTFFNGSYVRQDLEIDSHVFLTKYDRVNENVIYINLLDSEGNSLGQSTDDAVVSTTGVVSSIRIYVVSSGVPVINFNIFDLTQMYGSGNEPTLSQFNALYPNASYPFTISEKQIFHTGILNTLGNTDVGSQFLYSLYNPLKDYFNLPNYMNLGGLYDWFLVNLFSGYNSPVYFIIFDLMIYWLAMSILWLIFDVLMYVPSMIHKMLDKARME